MFSFAKLNLDCHAKFINLLPNCLTISALVVLMAGSFLMESAHTVFRNTEDLSIFANN